MSKTASASAPKSRGRTSAPKPLTVIEGSSTKRSVAKKPSGLAGVSVEIVNMTPKLANDFLKKNTRNRKMKQKALEQYVDDLKNGYWQFNGDPIRLTNKGNLLDGQHRLTAIVESGVTIPMVLVTGIPEQAQITIDVGARRSFSDHLRLQGENNSVALASVVRLYAVYERNNGQDRWLENHRISFTVLERIYRQHPGLIHSNTEGRKSYDQGLKLSKAALGVAHYVLNGIDSKDAQAFFSYAETGAGLFDDGPTQPILKLREFATPRKIFEHRRAFVSLGGIFKAWNAYREGRTIVTAAPRFGGAKPEKFPWPI